MEEQNEIEREEQYMDLSEPEYQDNGFLDFENPFSDLNIGL